MINPRPSAPGNIKTNGHETTIKKQMPGKRIPCDEDQETDMEIRPRCKEMDCREEGQMSETITADDFRRRQRARRNAKVGISTEEEVCVLMRRLGFVMVEPIERAWKVVRSGGKITRAFPAKKVSGDISAMTLAGKKVLVEVKSRSTINSKGEPVLRYSALEPHQIEALDTVQKHKGLAILAWYKGPNEIALLDWPVPGFGPGKSLTWAHALQSVEYFGIRHPSNNAEGR